jgi:hypothetical protein
MVMGMNRKWLTDVKANCHLARSSRISFLSARVVCLSPHPR